MNDVVVNINGNAEGLKRELDKIPSQVREVEEKIPRERISSPERQTVPPDNRLIEDLRETLSGEGVKFIPRAVENNSIIQRVEIQQRESIERQINEKYNERKKDMTERMSLDYKEADEEVEFDKSKYIKELGSAYNDPMRKKIVDNQFEEFRNIKYKQIGERFDEEEKQIEDEKNEELSKANKELTDAIKELSKEISRRAGKDETADSFLGGLRSERRKLVSERESASTESEALEKQARINELDEKLRNVLSGGSKEQIKSPMDSLLTGSQGFMNIMSGMESGNIGGMIMGGSMAYTGLSGMALKKALKVSAIAGIIASIAGSVKDSSYEGEEYGDLARLRGTVGGEAGFQGTRKLVSDLTSDDYYRKYGMTALEFSKVAEKRVRGRGTSEDWYQETQKGIGLETSLGLKRESLIGGGMFDRYGIQVTDALSRMVTILSKISESGVSLDDFTRVQEKFDIQQSIMQGYYSRTDKPNYDVANSILAAFSSIKGVTQDERIGSDIEQFQSMVRNPINERMKALVYSTVADLFPETQGRMSLIEQKIYDPNNEGKIMQEVLSRITRQFGGPETDMGYFALRAVLPNIAPDRMMSEVKELTAGGTAEKLLRGGVKDVSGEAETNMKNWVNLAEGYTSNIKEGLKGLETTLKTTVFKVINMGAGATPDPAKPRR